MRYTSTTAWLGALLGVGVTLLASGAAAEMDDFISPVTNPVNFEDPRATTEIRPIHAYHKISPDFITQGGWANVAAVQLRVALTDRFALIATKDGYVWLHPDKAVPNADGWANLAFGGKYALLQDPALGLIGTLGARYEVASGNRDVLQGYGDGVFNVFLSGGWGIDKFHLLAYTGPRLPVSGDDSTFWDTSLHADYKIGWFYPLVELNWVQTLDGGRRLPIDQEGFDFFNLGSKNAGGEGVVTAALGARCRLTDTLELWENHKGGIDLGFAFERHITHRSEIFEWRMTSDLIFWMR